MMRPIDTDDLRHLIPMAEFVEACKNNSFIDYDGWGYLSTEKTYDDATAISPSRAVKKSFKPDPKFTHVFWFNR